MLPGYADRGCRSEHSTESGTPVSFIDYEAPLGYEKESDVLPLAMWHLKMFKKKGAIWYVQDMTRHAGNRRDDQKDV